MTVRKFIAPSAREALRQVKEALGPDAIVLSNKSVAQGVEITAMSADGLDALSAHVAVKPAPVPPPAAPAMPAGIASYASMNAGNPDIRREEQDYTVSLSSRPKSAQSPYQAWQPAATPLRPLPPRTTPPPTPVTEHGAPSVRNIAELPPTEVAPRVTEKVSAEVTHLREEVQGIKQLLERQLAGFAWGAMSRESPVRAQLLGELLDAGFSGQFARKLAGDLPDDMLIEEARKWSQAAVGRRLRTLSSDEDLVDKGGVYALVGPTGVGKTTTTAKLAARCVVRYGADKLALLTTDSYRIGAHEQLRIYGRILGVPVHVVRDGEDLRHTLADLRDKHLVLIDTVGMSQRDRMVAEQAAMLSRSGQVNRLLLLNATSRGDTLDDVVRAYAGEDLAGCLLTKLDETATIAPAIDTVIRHGLVVGYVTTGQRVPEDLHIPNRNYLLHRCFKTAGSGSPHHLTQDELGLAVAGSDIPPNFMR